MPCFMVLLALALPRVTIALLWLFSNWFMGMFDTPIWPVLGFIFMPTTLLCYSAIFNWYDNTWGGIQIVLIVIAVLMDSGLWYGGSRRRE